eukprot:gene46546-62257_t
MSAHRTDSPCGPTPYRPCLGAKELHLGHVEEVSPTLHRPCRVGVNTLPDFESNPASAPCLGAEMATASRDLTTVDLRGLKPHLARLAATRGVTLSGVIRELLASAARVPHTQPPGTAPEQEPAARVRISMRLAGDEASALAAAARAAVAAGATIWNDVTALTFAPDAPEAAAELGCEVVLMHMLGEPRSMQVEPRHQDVVAGVRDYLAARAEAAMAAG